MNFVRYFMRYAIVCLLLSGLALATPASGTPDSPEKASSRPAAEKDSGNIYKLSYKIYLGGLKLLTADMVIDRSYGQSYAVAVKAETTGLARLITPWEGTITAQGRYKGGQPVAERYKSVSIWPENRITKRFTYTYDGALKTLEITDQEQPDLTPPDKALGDDTRDLLSALMYFAEAVTRDQTCGNPITVFDAKRRFELEGHPERKTTLKSSRYNIYDGPALHCDFEMTPMGGQWGESLRGWMAGFYGSQNEGDRPSVWFGAPASSSFYVPVKLRAKVKYGTAFAHLQKVTVVPAHEEKNR